MLCYFKKDIELMKMCFIMRTDLLLLLSIVTVFCTGANGFNIADQIAEVTQMCCSQGSRYANSNPSGSSTSCSSSQPPDEVPKDFGSICISTMDKCCQEVYKEKTDCNDGVQYAKKKQCGLAKSEIGQTCCEECTLGRLTGSTQGKSGCSKESGEEDGSTYALRKGAFRACCLEAAKEKDPVPDSRETKPTTKPNSNSPTVASLCEEYAPNELCAHHCIPVPGSYRCECNPGFMLMADGKNCLKLEVNRCKPKNPCEHKCNDNGKEVKCSCKRGYELMADQTSCQDINECELETHLCLEDTICQNTEGSYKCIPTKPRPPGLPGIATTLSSRPMTSSCPPGYQMNAINKVCDDVDECKLPAPPCPKYLCANTIGGYTCGGKPGTPLTDSSHGVRTMVPPEEERCPPGFRTGYQNECEDIDECEDHTDDCNKISQICLNRHGTFACHDRVSKHCPPGFKYNAQKKTCDDIDECSENENLCPRDQECFNVAGEYLCKPTSTTPKKNCPEGTRRRPGTNVCEDIDECREESHLCDQFQNCLNTYGGHECRCKIGFEMDPLTRACTDINECLTDQHKCQRESQRCDNTVGSFSCVRLTGCGTGYVLHASSGQCEDVDECARNLHNCKSAGPNFYCVNLPGTFSCVKNTTKTTSTTLPPDEYYYYDEDEEDNQTLPQGNTPPATNSKVDVINEITTTSRPPTTYTEPNTMPTPSIPTELQPAEPKTDNVPETPPLEKSPDHFTPPTKKPESIVPGNSEAKSQLPSIVTVNKPKDPITVRVDNKEGTFSVDTKQLPKNTWTNIIGKESDDENLDPQKVQCLGGYKNLNGGCVDIDECRDGTHVCSSLTEVCRNTDGGYLCDCAPGFRKESATGWCSAIPTSTTTQEPNTYKIIPTPPPFTSAVTTTTTTTVAPAPLPSYGRTTNRWGFQTYRPYKVYRPRVCDAGYHFNPSTEKCDDINECTNGVARCASVEICINTEGGYRCVCPPSWTLDQAGHRCVPIRNPDVFPSGFGNIEPDFSPPATHNGSVITVGTEYGSRSSKYLPPDIRVLPDSKVIASCPWGYKINPDDNTCTDEDECSSGKAQCGPLQQCTNYPGGYTCNCPAGHRLLGQNSCEDVDECSIDRRVCSQHSDCVNTVGAYQCQCHSGFRTAPSNDKVCIDVDECTDNKPGSLCDHTCVNVWGGYRCSCHRGYVLHSDNRTCVDLDECVQFKDRHLCIGRCVNVPGSYKCSCPTGYRLGQDQRSCIDIDECETGEAPCAGGRDGSVCQNTRGGYKCHQIACPPGYQLEKKNRCTPVMRCAYNDWDCMRMPTYSYNYITFVSNLYVPPTHVDLFTMRGPSRDDSMLKFQLKLVQVNAPPHVVRPADMSCFRLQTTSSQAVVSLVRSLEGPQSIELELSMELYMQGVFGGSAVAKLFIFVSEYEF